MNSNNFFKDLVLGAEAGYLPPSKERSDTGNTANSHSSPYDGFSKPKKKKKKKGLKKLHKQLLEMARRGYGDDYDYGGYLPPKKKKKKKKRNKDFTARLIDFAEKAVIKFLDGIVNRLLDCFFSPQKSRACN